MAPAVALTFGTIVGLVVVEGVVRLLGHDLQRFESTAVAETHRTSRRGPVDRPQPTPDPGPSFRILAVGDSFTWGAGVFVEDSYPRRLERLLWSASPPVRVEVDVLSRPGWNSVDAARVLATRWATLAPDLLLVGYVLNDPLPASSAEQGKIREPLHRRRPGSVASRWLYRHSFLFDLVWDRVENSRQRRAFREHYEQLHEAGYSGWRAAEEALQAMVDLATADGVPAVLLIFPVFDFETVEGYAYTDIHRSLRRVGRRHGFRVLDLLPTYRGVDGRRLPVVPFTDAHPNEIAHRMAAQSIARFLLREGLVPSASPGDGPGSETLPLAAP